jgi:hypothetical protein
MLSLVRLAAIHGIGNRFEGTDKLAASWLPALNSGLREAGFPVVDAQEFALIFFGSIFRPPGTRGDESALSQEDEAWAERLLLDFNREAARLAALNRDGSDPKGENPKVQSPDDGQSRARTPSALQAVLKQLSKSRFFKALGPERLLLADLREVRRFLHEPDIKRQVLERFVNAIPSGARVVVSHSLGSVVAYEALCLHPEWNVHTLVTLGSPLGIRNLVFDALTPRPRDGVGVWPIVTRWVNIADQGDIVCLEKDLAPLFGRVEDVRVYNGWHSHAVEIYLTARETGKAIGEGLAR